MSSITAPTTLASFNIPADVPVSPVASSSKITLPVTLGPVFGGEDAECVAAVQGGALWIYDLSSHRATTSFTVPPSTRFSCSPLSFQVTPARLTSDASENTTKKAVKQRRTVIGVAQGEDVATTEQRRVLWAWDGDDVYEKRSIKLDHEIDQLEYLPLSESFLAAGATGLAVFPSSLEPISIAFDSTSPVCRILPLARKSSHDPLRLLVVHVNGTTRLCKVSHVDQERPSLEALAVIDGSPELDKDETVVDGVLEDDGYLHLYTSRQRILPRAARIQANNLTATNASSSSSSKPYQILGSTSSSTKAVPISSIPTPSGRLLISLVSPSGGASVNPPTLFLFNPTLPAVVTTAPLPTSTSTTLTHRDIVRLSSTTLGLSSFTSAAASQAERCIISLIDVNVPANGVGIAGLLGSAEMTKRFLGTAQTQSANNETGEGDAVAQLTLNLQQTLEGAIRGQEGPAETIWRAWFAEHPDDRLEAMQVRRIVQILFSAALGKNVDDPSIPNPAEGGEVKVTGPRGAYAAAIVTDLLQRGLLKDGMWKDGGVVGGAMLSLGDWDSILVALSVVSNISSTTLVTLLHQVLHPTITNAGVSQPPSLRTFLKPYIKISVSEPMHKAAMFKLLKVEDVTSVLEVLVDWAESLEQKQEEGVISWEAGAGPKAKGSKGDMPPMKAIVSHINMIMDSHLPLLVAHKPAQSLIERLNDVINPVVSVQRELQNAHGIIDAYVTLNKREEREKQLAKAKGKAKGKGIADQGVGLYRLEEIAL